MAAPAQLLGRPCEPLTGPAGGGARLRVCSRWFAGSPGRSVRCDGTRCRMMVATVLRIWASALFGLCHTLRTDTVTNLASVQNCFNNCVDHACNSRNPQLLRTRCARPTIPCYWAIGIYFEQLGRGPCAEKLLCHYTLFVQGERCWAEL